MTFTKTIERLQLLHDLIAQQKTGTPEQLAQRLGVSRSYLYVMIDDLKLLNLHVSYSRKNRSFYYKCEVDIEFLLKIHPLRDDDLVNINAGDCAFRAPSSIVDGRNLSLYSYLAGYKESDHRLYKMW